MDLLKNRLYLIINNNKRAQNLRILCIFMEYSIEQKKYISFFELIDETKEKIYSNFTEEYIEKMNSIIKKDTKYLLSDSKKQIKQGPLKENFEKFIGINYDIIVDHLISREITKLEEYLLEKLGKEIMKEEHIKTEEKNIKEDPEQITIIKNKLEDLLNKIVNLKDNRILNLIENIINIKDNKLLDSIEKDLYKNSKDKILQKKEKIELKSSKVLWSDCKLDHWKEATFELNKKNVQRVFELLEYKKDDLYCDFNLLNKDNIEEKIQKQFIENKFSEAYKESLLKSLNIYINKFIHKTNVIMKTSITNNLTLAQQIASETTTNKTAADIPDFEKLLELLVQIKNETKNNIEIRIISLIFSYGYYEKDNLFIGVLRHNDLLNTDIKNSITDKPEKNYICYLTKKWYFIDSFTKNSKKREIKLSNKFLDELEDLRKKLIENFQKERNNNLITTTKLLGENIITNVHIARLYLKYKLPKLNDMRSSNETYSHNNFNIDQGQRLSYNMGHLNTTRVKSYLPH
jgi:hypothetical protein